MDGKRVNTIHCDSPGDCPFQGVSNNTNACNINKQGCCSADHWPDHCPLLDIRIIVFRRPNLNAMDPPVETADKNSASSEARKALYDTYNEK